MPMRLVTRPHLPCVRQLSQGPLILTRRFASSQTRGPTAVNDALPEADEKPACPSSVDSSGQGSPLTTLFTSRASIEDCTSRRKASLEARAARLRSPDRAHFDAIHEALPSSASAQGHHDLHSFLHFAHQTGLKTTTTVYKGTLFEYTVAAAVKRYGMSLARVGRANDFGIDLRGHWTLPCATRLPVLVQCKMSKPLPQVIRELGGTSAGAPAAWRGANTIALLASQHQASPGVVQALQMSSWPVGFVQVSRDGVVKQFLWNARAADRGLTGVGVTLRHQLNGHEDLDSIHMGTGSKLEHEKAIALTWLGRPWVPSA